MSFPRLGAEPRTDSSFRNREEPQHHRKLSIMEDLPIDMIADFVIADPLHLLELGVMRKLLRIWIDGDVTKNFKLKKNEKLQLDCALLQSNLNLPSEIHRSVRSIEWIRFWKGSEFRTILLYVGLTALKNVLDPIAYKHFLRLFCAVTICSADLYKRYIPLAKTLFDEYIETYIELYGIGSITRNVHNLTHVVDNVQRFGNLNSISTNPFENTARHIKLKLKQCNKSLEQMARRISELALIQRTHLSANALDDLIFKFPIDTLTSSNPLHYKYVCIKNSIILSTRKSGDKWFLTKSDEIVEFHYAYMRNDDLFILGSCLKEKQDFFTRPFKSGIINVFECSKLIDCEKTFSLNEIKCKMFCLNYDEKLIFVPLLHSFDVFR